MSCKVDGKDVERNKRTIGWIAKRDFIEIQELYL